MFNTKDRARIYIYIGVCVVCWVEVGVWMFWGFGVLGVGGPAQNAHSGVKRE